MEKDTHIFEPIYWLKNKKTGSSGNQTGEATAKKFLQKYDFFIEIL